MNILIVTALFLPEPVTSARMAFELVDGLLARGVRVTVICPWPSRVIKDRSDAQQVDIELASRSVNVVRVPSFTHPKSSILGRARESISFGLYVGKHLRANRSSYDVVYINAWPMFGQSIIVDQCTRLDTRSVLHIQDIYPDAWLQTAPHFVRYTVGRLLKRWDTRCFNRASRQIVISHEMRDYYVRCRAALPDHISVVYNWQDSDQFSLGAPELSIARREYGIKAGDFIYMYLGNVGKTAAVDLLVRAFAASRLGDASLIIVGEGSEKEKCQRLVQELRLQNVRFLSERRMAQVPILQSLADILLLPLRSGAGLASVPSKLPSYMLSGRPIIASVDGNSSTAHAVHDSECGWVGPAGNTTWLAAKISDVRRLGPEHLQSIGARGRSYALRHFSMETGVERMCSCLLQLGSLASR